MRCALALLLLFGISFARADGLNVPGSSSGLPLSGGTLTGALNGTQVNLNYPMYSTSTPAATWYSYVSGTVPGSPTSLGAAQFTITGDIADSHTIANYLSTLHIDHNFGGSGMKGSRAGLDLSMVMQGTSSNTGNTTAYYVGIADYVSCGYNDNGASGFANVSGSCVGINPIANLGTGTYWYTLNGEEIDVQATSGSSVQHTFGTLSVKSGTGARGISDDAAIAFASGSGTPTWDTILQVGKTDGAPPTSSTTYLLRCISNVGGSTPCPIGYGIDLSNFSITNYAFRSPGFSVDGAGNTVANALRLPPTTVSALGTCNSGAAGTLRTVSDANAVTVNATLVGGGSNFQVGICNGANWVGML